MKWKLTLYNLDSSSYNKHECNIYIYFFLWEINTTFYSFFYVYMAQLQLILDIYIKLKTNNLHEKYDLYIAHFIKPYRDPVHS